METHYVNNTNIIISKHIYIYIMSYNLTVVYVYIYFYFSNTDILPGPGAFDIDTPVKKPPLTLCKYKCVCA
jgi:hypothetical protein